MNAPLRLLPGQAFDASRYEAACRLIAEVSGLDEVKAIRDQAEALRVLARQARNLEPEIACAEIRIRAERRLGEIMAGHVAAGLIRPGNPGFDKPATIRGDGTGSPRVRLAELGIDERLADRCRKYAALAAEDFADRLAVRRAAAERGARVSVRLDLADKAERRAAREAELGAKVAALPDKRYGVILADPEWRFEPWSRETGLDRCSADNHYPTSETAAIAARDVASIAAPDCVLFLWATVPMLPQALDVMAAWGFAYRSHQVWDKGVAGTGYWHRNRHELLLLGVRGDVPCPAPGDNPESLFAAPRGRHSAKPDCVLEQIERLYPSLPKIELHRRGAPRPGWDAWGIEADEVPDTCPDLAQRLVDAGFAPNGHSLESNGLTTHDARDKLGDLAHPWSLPSRAFGYPMELRHDDGVERLALSHPALAEHPLVAAVEARIGVRAAFLDNGRGRGGMAPWWHAVDLMSEEHWRALLETRRFTSDECLYRAIVFALESPAGYQGAAKKTGRILTITAKEILLELGADEPPGRSRALLLDRQVLWGGEISDSDGKRKTLRYPLNLMRHDAAGAWLMVHGLEDGWFERGRDGFLQISAKGRAWREEADAEAKGVAA